MNGYGYAAPMTRQQEKAELSYLNDRYSNYIAKVRKMKQDANQGDSADLLNAIRNLEDEMGIIKDMYEKELEKQRRETEAAKASKKPLELAAKQNQTLQDSLAQEQLKNKKLAGELAQKDLELNKIKGERDHLAKKLPEMLRNADGQNRDFERLKQRLDKETVAKHDALDEVDKLRKQLEFQNRVNNEQMAEMKSRLEDKAKQILKLEEKVRELSTSDNSLHNALARVRETSRAELEKYKKDSEAQYAKNLQDLKRQMDEDARNIVRLAEENKKLNSELDDAKRENQILKNKIHALEQNKSDLANSLDQERQKSDAHLRVLEAKIRDLQDALMHKLKEIGSGREPPIGAEIEALKALVDDEEKRLSSVRLNSSSNKLPRLKSGSNLVNSRTGVGAGAGGNTYTGKYDKLTGIPTTRRAGPHSTYTHDYSMERWT